MTVTSNDKEIDLFVASKIGSFKHVKYHTEPSKNNKKCIENLVDIKTLQKDDAITCMQWGNKDQTEILIARKNQQIQVFSTLTQSVVGTHTVDFAPGHIVGLGRYKRRLLAASSTGVVRIWGKKGEETVQTGGKLDAMSICGDEETVFATGGEENDLKIWQIGSPEAIFSAKNLPHDWLQLRRPIWVGGVAFAPGEGGRVVAVCSRHGYVRLYDSRAQRRPVSNVEFPNMAAACLVPSFDERQYLVGFARGQLHQVDLRANKPDRGFKGAVGAVTSIQTAPRDRLIVSASLDRHLRVHRYHDKEMVHKQYLTSKLCAVLVQTATSTPLRNAPEVKEEDVKREEEEGREEVRDDLDEIFERMETIGEKPKKKKIDLTEDDEQMSKKIKPSTEGSTENPDEAIRELLRSTEKTKRQREKKRREKRAKSLYHNA